jgi:hypothetical protein
MRLRHLLATLATTLALAAPAAQAAPCVGFSDVDETSPFCPNVEWVKNRAITLGCPSPGPASQYCPNEPTLRIQMAAFLNRLGTTLTPVVLFKEDPLAATNLDLEPVVCQTGEYAVANYPRSANAKGSLLVRADGSFSAALWLVYSSDGGTTWLPMHTTSYGMYALGSANDFAQSDTFTGLVPLSVGTSYRFGLKAMRHSGGGQIQDGACHLAVELRSRDGATSPLEPR